MNDNWFTGEILDSSSPDFLTSVNDSIQPSSQPFPMYGLKQHTKIQNFDNDLKLNDMHMQYVAQTDSLGEPNSLLSPSGWLENASTSSSAIVTADQLNEHDLDDYSIANISSNDEIDDDDYDVDEDEIDDESDFNEQEDSDLVPSKRKLNEHPTGDTKSKVKNREHAKNTRIRKKNYMETLKDAIKKLADAREQVDRDRRILLSRLAEQTSVRKKVLQTMYHYRSTGETNRLKWSCILDDDFALYLPITPYRSFPPTQVHYGQRRITGIDAVIEDTRSLFEMCQSIGQRTNASNIIRRQYYFGPEDMVISGDNLMCRWVMQTENARECGAFSELYNKGMLKATFNSKNKLLSMEQTFDVMNFMHQLRRATGQSNNLARSR